MVFGNFFVERLGWVQQQITDSNLGVEARETRAAVRGRERNLFDAAMHSMMMGECAGDSSKLLSMQP